MQGTNANKASSYVMLPHETFVALYNSTKGWASSILPDPSKLTAFWDTFSGHPSMMDHPISKRRDRDHAIPFSLHGDEVPITGVGKIWCRAALCFSMSSLMQLQEAGVLRNPASTYGAFFEKFILPTDGVILGTMDTFWMLMKWSFEILMSGKWPSKNWKGEKIHGFSIYIICGCIEIILSWV